MSYLKNKGMTLNELKIQYSGRKFGELVLHHLKTQSEVQIKNAIIGLKDSVHPKLVDTTEKFLETITFGFAKSKDFWKTDCGESLMLFINTTKNEAIKNQINVDDDYAFDIFNLIVLTLAQRAQNNNEFMKHIKKSIKSNWLF